MDISNKLEYMSPEANLGQSRSLQGEDNITTQYKCPHPSSEGYIAGVDEAGCGPLAGPVIAACVILDPKNPIPGLKDSKKLSPKRREALFSEITQNSLAFASGHAEVAEIDRLNILQATLLAMQRAILALPIKPQQILVDGRNCPKIANSSTPIKAIINGDNLVAAISAASIIAKVLRDREMLKYDALYPQYGFARHKGYGTKEHLAAIKKYGIIAIHRKSFSPCRTEER